MIPPIEDSITGLTWYNELPEGWVQAGSYYDFLQLNRKKKKWNGVALKDCNERELIERIAQNITKTQNNIKDLTNHGSQRSLKYWKADLSENQSFLERRDNVEYLLYSILTNRFYCRIFTTESSFNLLAKHIAQKKVFIKQKPDEQVTSKRTASPMAE